MSIFKLNLKNPEEGIKQLANQLFLTKYPKATHQNGSCTRPNVAKPNLGDSKIAELLTLVSKGINNKLKERPKTKERPSWAGNPTFTADRADPVKFDVFTNNETVADVPNQPANQGRPGNVAVNQPATSTTHSTDSSPGNSSSSSTTTSTNPPSSVNTPEFKESKDLDINVSEIIPIYPRNGGTAFYIGRDNSTKGNFYKMNQSGSVGSFLGKIGARDNPTKIVANYTLNNTAFALFYEPDLGVAQRLALTSEGYLDVGNTSKYAQENGWRKTWHTITSYQAGGRMFLLFYDQDVKEAHIYIASDKKGKILEKYIGKFSFGPKFNQVTTHETNRNTYLVGHAVTPSGKAFIVTYELNADGTVGPKQLDALTTRATWSSLTTFNEGINHYVHLYDKSSGDIYVYKLSGYGKLESSPSYVSKAWAKGWDKVSTYNIGHQSFIMYLHSESGNGFCYHLNTDGKYGPKATVFKDGKIQRLK